MAQSVGFPEGPLPDGPWPAGLRAGAGGGAAHLTAWLVPAAAAGLAALSLVIGSGPVTDPPAWPAAPHTLGYHPAHAVPAVGAVLVAVVTAAAVVAVLGRGRGRWPARIAALLGVAALAALVVPVFRSAVSWAELLPVGPGGEPAAAVAVERLTEVPLLPGGAAVASLSWALAGLAVWRSGFLHRADGVLFAVGGLLVGFGLLYLGIFITLGALLLLAAGIGIAATATRGGASRPRP